MFYPNNNLKKKELLRKMQLEKIIPLLESFLNLSLNLLFFKLRFIFKFFVYLQSVKILTFIEDLNNK